MRSAYLEYCQVLQRRRIRLDECALAHVGGAQHVNISPAALRLDLCNTVV